MNTPTRLAHPLPISQREMREFHARQRRTSFVLLLESVGEPQLAQEATDGLLDPVKWSVEQ